VCLFKDPKNAENPGYGSDAAKGLRPAPRFAGLPVFSMGQDNGHSGIPLDADGVPIFFILPPELRAKYEKKLARCEAGWRATSDPLFVREALLLTYLHRQLSLLWPIEPACDLIAGQRTKGDHTRAYNAAIRRMRYEAVRDARGGGPKHGGLSWEKAYKRAAEVLAPTRAAAEPSTMKMHYNEVKSDLKNGRGGLYALPKIPRAKLGDVLKSSVKNSETIEWAE
jgi:hypothetical protein